MEFRVLKYWFFPVVMLLFSACTKEVHVKIPGFEEKVVIEGSIETDGFPFVLISKNKNVYASTSQNEILSSYLSGAQVWVSNGQDTIQLTEVCTNNLPQGMDTVVAAFLGIPVDVLHATSMCAYIGTDANFKGEVGKTYTLKVDFEGKTYQAHSTILSPINFTSSAFKPDVKYPNYGYIDNFLQDPSTKGNAYLTESKRLNVDSTGEPKDKRFYKSYLPYFDDEFFNGKQFEYSIDAPMTYGDSTIDEKYRGFYKKGDTVQLKLSNYEHNIFEFLDAVSQQKASGGSPFSLPMNAVGNIPGALGCWIAFSPAYSIVVCQ